MTIDQGKAINRFKAIPKAIWALGFVSMFMDISSEMIHSLLPVYMVSALGVSTVSVGLIEGIAEATASITKVFSGVLSDYLGKRKLLTAIGYGMAAFTKPLFPLANTVGVVIAARFIDRVGKGIRGAPRDAMVGDIAPLELRGACFGVRQSLDTAGAFIGPLLAIAFMALFSDNFRFVFWIAVIPAFIAFALIVFGVDEPKNQGDATEKVRTPIKLADIWKFGGDYWWLVALAAMLTLARFSEAFLVLRAHSVGLSLAWVPAVMVIMNVVYAFSAYPIGHLSDHMSRRTLLAVGFLVLIGSDLLLGVATNYWIVFAGVILWGLHMGITQGLFAALITDSTPQHLRGSAFGMFNLVSGLVMLISNILAGWLWQHYGAGITFFAGTGFTLLTMLGLILWYCINARN